jgi:Ser-tRNA(Ala) deacylase AlaX
VQQQSPSVMAKQLDNHISRLLRRFDLAKQTRSAREAITDLRQNMVDARIYTNDYELSETREEQLQNAKEAKKWLEAVRKNILIASQYDVFNAVDTAHLSAQADHIAGSLK